MKILVTGGSGFIGSNFIEYILQNTDMEVINIDLLTYAGVSSHPTSPRYTFYQMDIGYDEVYDVLIKHQPDYIINFAAETHVDRSIEFPDSFVETNIFGTYNLLRCLKKYMDKHPFKFIHVSTDEVFGSLNLGDPSFKETNPYDPRSPYSATKASSDHLVRAFHHTYGLPAIITNCSNNYGPRQFPEKFIPVAILRAYMNKEIPVYGNGKNIRDWLYVGDHCDALFQILRKGINGESYNIGGETELSNNEIANRILLHLGKPLSLVKYVEDRKGHDFRYSMNISHIKNTLRWQPQMDFNRGLGKTINWYINNLEWVTSCVNLESF
jgi:dTDP-glucose 4,6-dehydratase